MGAHDAHDAEDLEAVEALLAEILTDAYGEDEQLWALRQAFEDHVRLPADAYVIGEPVSVVAIDYDGNERRGLTARCRKAGGGEHVLAAAELAFPRGSDGAIHVAAYRKWQGLEPLPAPHAGAVPPAKRPKAAEDDLDLSRPIELVVLSVKQSAVRCRLCGSERELTLRAQGIWSLAPGEIATVRGRKFWHHGRHPYLSGSVEAHRLDVPALGLVPLRLEPLGKWDPAEQYWGEDGESLEAWAKPIVARGPRPQFEMEQVLPGQDPEDWDSDPIQEAAECAEGGDRRTATDLLMGLLALDLRCLAAHAHLGHLSFDLPPQHAIRYFEAGVRIGELSAGTGRDRVLPWGLLDNRPFLRCLHGYGLCLWRLGRTDEAAEVFERMLWLNPTDNQGIRFMLPHVRAGERREDHHANG